VSVDTKVLSAMWLWKHQDEIVKECKLGIITKTACDKRLAAFYSRRKWLGHYNPAGCIDCERAKGIVLNEEEKGRITQWGGTEDDNCIDEDARLDEIEPPIQIKHFEIWA